MALYTIETYGELQPHLGEEWLVTNGIGGYAASTVVGCNTRRYHGLLCAATLPPVGRMMLLNRIGEILILDGDESRLLELSINQFADGRFHPRGDKFLRRFEMDDVSATWEFDVEGVRVIKQLQMPWLNNAAGIRYTIEPNGRRVEMLLLPFVSLRDFHAERHGEADFNVTHDDARVSVADSNLSVHIAADGATYSPEPDWWQGQVYAIETERGQDDTEDLFKPGKFSLTATQPAAVTLWASASAPMRFDWDAELKRRRAAIAAACSLPENRSASAGESIACGTGTEVVRRLAHAANDFVVYRKSPDGKDGTSVIAGYPWFADWGRDTMISLPGLFLTTGRFAQARQVLTVFAQYVSEGMIPNRFDDYTNEPSYNTVDASLWYIHAAHEYARLSGDQETFDKVLRPACRAILDGYRRGTRFNIHMDPGDGLVSQGDETTQLTWMDAKSEGICFTPRQGKPVEINALWYHALVLMGEKDLAAKVAESFRRLFWISPFRGLADVIDGNRKDTSIRPNQIFAVGLPHSPLTSEQQSAVVEVVRRELLTPFGLRTLSPADPGFKGRYAGPQRERDAAYHNGTVWPWPIGFFLDAYLKVNQRSPESIEQAKLWLQPLLDQTKTGSVGQIPEIFEGDPPHRAVGCFAQAWSVAEVLRLAVELGM